MKIRLTEDGRLDVSETELQETFAVEEVFVGLSNNFAVGTIYDSSFEDGEMAVQFETAVLPDHNARRLRKLLDMSVLWRGEEFPYSFFDVRSYTVPNGSEWGPGRTYHVIRMWFTRPHEDD